MRLYLGLEGAILRVLPGPEGGIGDRVVDDLRGIAGEGRELRHLEVGKDPAPPSEYANALEPSPAGERKREGRFQGRIDAARGERFRRQGGVADQQWPNVLDRRAGSPRRFVADPKALRGAGADEKVPIGNGGKAGPCIPRNATVLEQADRRALGRLVAEQGVRDDGEDAVEVRRLRDGFIHVPEEGSQGVHVRF